MSERFDLFTPAVELDFGSDIALSDNEFGGDLVVSSTKDGYELVSGRENLKEAIRRRLSTPEGFLKRFIRDYTNLFLVNYTYGNPAYKYLSEPVEPSMIFTLKAEVMSCLQEENRIEIQDVNVSIVPVNNYPRISLSIQYTEVGQNTIESVTLSQTESGFLVG
jgi:phage baseplate assembly protein W